MPSLKERRARRAIDGKTAMSDYIKASNNALLQLYRLRAERLSRSGGLTKGEGSHGQ